MNIRYRDVSSNRADKSAVKSAMYHSFRDELEKIAGEIDHDALSELSKKLRKGDIVSFKQHAADKKTLKDLAMTKALSGPIAKITGSPYSHTGLIDSIDPDTGRIKLIHNFEQGGAQGVAHQYLDELADSSSFKFSRPRVSEDVAGRAVDAARSAIGDGKYSRSDLVSMAPQEAVRRLSGENSLPSRVAAAVTGLQSNVMKGKDCDPATGICSFLPVHAYGEAMGGAKDNAMRSLVGDVKYTGSTSVSPAMLASSDVMDHIGDYTPKNLNPSVSGQAAKLGLDAVKDRLGRFGKRVLRRGL
jgi:hypothetical protein